MKEIVTTTLPTTTTPTTTTTTSSKNNDDILSQHLDVIISSLLAETNSEEGIRSVVADCMGGLLLKYPDTIIPVLLELCGSKSSGARWIGKWCVV